MTGYLWRGRPDLERQNEAIMDARAEREKQPGPLCGTVEGWRSHRQKREAPCTRCAIARGRNRGKAAA